MPFRSAHLATLLVLLAVLLAAEAGAETTYLVAGWLVDPLNEELIRDPVMAIEDGKIISVASNGTVPESATTIDLGDATILPGLAPSRLVTTPILLP